MRRKLLFLLILLLLGAAAWLVREAGPFLMIDHPEKSDVILVLGGDEDMARYNRAVELLHQGYAPVILIDAVRDKQYFGKTQAQWAEDFVAHLPTDLQGKVRVCGFSGDSTAEELRSAVACLQREGARSVLIATHDFHTRRSLATARKLLPQYHWSVAAARTAASTPNWWRSRWAAKYVIMDYEKLIWWKLVDSHRSW